MTTFDAKMQTIVENVSYTAQRYYLLLRAVAHGGPDGQITSDEEVSAILGVTGEEVEAAREEINLGVKLWNNNASVLNAARALADLDVEDEREPEPL
jgi:hypothetical protein